MATVLDNAPVNDALIDLLGDEDDLPRNGGRSTQVRCYNHILNLAMTAVAGKKVKRAAKKSKEGKSLLELT